MSGLTELSEMRLDTMQQLLRLVALVVDHNHLMVHAARLMPAHVPPPYRAVWQRARSMFADGRAFSLDSFAADVPNLEQFRADILSAPAQAAKPEVAEHLADQVTQLGRRIEFAEKTAAASGQALNLSVSIDELEHQTMESITDNIPGSSLIKNVGELMDAALRTDRDIKENGAIRSGMTTGLGGLDYQLDGGFRRGHLAVIAAEPGTGKSLLAGHMALHLALAGRRGVYIALESTAESIVRRMICGFAGVSASGLATGTLNGREWDAYLNAERELRARIANNILFVERADLSIPDIAAITLQAQHEHDTSWVVIDTGDLIKAPGGTATERADAAADGCQMLKKLGRGQLVIVCKQLNRRHHAGGVATRPTLPSLHNSSRWGTHAEVVVFLWRPWAYASEERRLDQPELEFVMEINVAKARDGRTGKMTVYVDYSRNKLGSLRAHGIYYDRESRRWTGESPQPTDGGQDKLPDLI